MKYIVLFIKKTLRYLLKPLSFIPAFAMMFFIFYMSSQPAGESSGLSYEVSKALVLGYNRLGHKGLSDMSLAALAVAIHAIVRKIAHVLEYFMLAICVGLPFYVYRIRGIGLMFLTGFICVAYAALDEYHQTFVPGRSGEPRDVLIDSIGIFFGVLLVRIIGYIGRKTIFAPLSLDKYEVVER